MRYVLKHLHRTNAIGELEVEGRYDSYGEAETWAGDWAADAGLQAEDWRQLFTIDEEKIGEPTPSPWFPAAEDVVHTEGHDTFDVDVVEAKDGAVIAYVVVWEGNHANTRLIIKAPDLLNELKSLLRIFERDDLPLRQEERPSGHGVGVFVTRRAAERWRTLIAEAEGKVRV